MLVAYLHGVRVLRTRGDDWARGRVLAWVLGCVVLLITTSSGVARFSPALFSVHMIMHMSLTMLVPVLLVLGGPVTLALRVLRPGGKTAGPREWLVWALHSPVTRVLAHPLVAASLFVGSFYLLYFTDLFEQAMLYHWAHQLMNIHFLVTGYLFFWQVIGVDRAPRPLPHLGRLAMLFGVMPFHAFFGVIVMNSQGVIAETFYRYLTLPWHSAVPDLLADQRLGGGIAWATGEIPMIIVVIALVSQWAKADDREARRTDRKAEQDGDAELSAYNAMLDQLAARDR
jgi:putative copper resistance protein D